MKYILMALTAGLLAGCAIVPLEPCYHGACQSYGYHEGHRPYGGRGYGRSHYGYYHHYGAYGYPRGY